MATTPTLLFIGCGNMGAAIAAGALDQMPGVRVVALDPDTERARSLLPPGAAVELHAEPSGLAGLRPDLVILGVKPQTLPELSAEVLALLRAAPVVSIMAGIGLERLSAALAPSAVVRVMPNLPSMIGEGMSLGCTTVALADSVRSMVEALFNAIGRFDWVADEVMFEKANPVFACGPGFVFAFAEQMILAAVAQGLPRDLAERLVHQTMLGSARMLSEDPRGAAGLKRAVSSPGGTTLAGLSVLEAEAGLPKILPGTLAAAHGRALELARMAG
ncbi:pyrroline-5-carboxylate reductase family protein [Fuscovulum ytuae]|uniref:Pyrroline-5-carboxylate reductase n=1 Tax=Fuscovulum ytuae TaxID=3042299 RepID=A0ABY8QD29_9RHOB|nr:pyrroline-5-carboxylate reductase [Fuscovulum sp. YMD61]WGV18177.1 pyrroline-5-carboxylate reductase [Fuscovulum sp. YMD61]